MDGGKRFSLETPDAAGSGLTLQLLLFSREVISNYFAILWTVAHQAPLSRGFSRQEYWSGLPCPPQGDLPNPGIEPRFPTLQADFFLLVFPCGSAGKESSCNAGDLGSIPGLGRSPGEGKGYTLQCSGLENSMDSIVHGVAKVENGLSDFHLHFLYLLSHQGCPGKLIQ